MTSIQHGSATWEPWTDGYAVGFKVTRGDRTEYVYLSPSQSDEDEEEVCAFVYTGTTGDPCSDEAHHFYLMLEDAP